jgi:hypothetical protein
MPKKQKSFQAGPPLPCVTIQNTDGPVLRLKSVSVALFRPFLASTQSPGIEKILKKPVRLFFHSLLELFKALDYGSGKGGKVRAAPGLAANRALKQARSKPFLCIGDSAPCTPVAHAQSLCRCIQGPGFLHSQKNLNPALAQQGLAVLVLHPDLGLYGKRHGLCLHCNAPFCTQLRYFVIDIAQSIKIQARACQDFYGPLKRGLFFAAATICARLFCNKGNPCLF